MKKGNGDDRNWLKEHKDVSKFNEKLLSKPLLILILGKRGSGKSVCGFKIAENIASKTTNQIYILNFPKPELLPNWIDNIQDLEEAENDSLVIVDEGAIQFEMGSMKKSKKMNLIKLFAIIRHKHMTLIFITQHGATLNLNIIRQVDTLILKEPSLLQVYTERPGLIKLYEKAKTHFSKIDEKEKIKYAYVIDDVFEGLIKINLPSFWSDEISKSYGNVEEELR